MSFIKSHALIGAWKPQRRPQNTKNTMNKVYNATRDGQVVMANDASSRAPAFLMNKIIKSKGGIGWPDDMITSAEPILLRSIKENLIEEYNSLVTPKVTKSTEDGHSSS